MLRIRLLSAPPAIAIDAEPCDVAQGDWPPVSVEAFVLVPAWQARPARGRRRVLATGPVRGVAAAVALSIGRGHDAASMRAVSLGPSAPARPALVVRASTARATDVSGARR